MWVRSLALLRWRGLRGDEGEGLVEQRRPAALSGGADGRPLPEPSAGRGERVGPPGADELVDAGWGSLTSRSPVRRSNDPKNWPSMRRHGRPIIVERVTPAWASIGSANAQKRASCSTGVGAAVIGRARRVSRPAGRPTDPGRPARLRPCAGGGRGSGPSHPGGRRPLCPRGRGARAGGGWTRRDGR